MGKNSLFQFFFRTFLSIVFAVILSVIAVYLYYSDMSATKIDNLLHEGIAYLEKDIKLSNNLSQEERLVLREKVKKFAEKKNLSAVRVINNSSDTVVDYQREPLPKKIEEIYNSLFIYNDKKITDLIPLHDDRVYLYHEIQVQHWKARIILQIPQEQITQMQEQTRDIIIIVILSSILIIISSFPTVFTQYKGLKNRNNELLQSNISTLVALGNAIAKRDSDTDAHNYRVTYYSVKIAQKLNLDKHTIQHIIKGAFLHDVGKIGISDNILLKPGKLTEDEFETMKNHVNFGLEIVNDVQWLENATKVIGGHHEKFDGTGYPKGIKGEDIPLEARIFSVADVFDALTSERPYKKPFSLEKSIEILEKDKGSHFDPHVVDIFVEIAHDLHSEVHHRSVAEIREIFEIILEPYFKV